MKSIIVLTVLIATVTVAIPLDEDHAAVVLKSENTNIGVDNWRWLSETSNGINQQETGEKTDNGISVRGSFTYTDPATNAVFTVSYIADRNGFQPSAAHLPKAPEA